jgi:hypothetical protein
MDTCSAICTRLAHRYVPRHADQSNPSTRVRLWVAERAAVLGVPISTRVLCATAVDRLDVDGAVLSVADSSNWPQLRESTDALGPRLAELEATVGEGPSTDARRLGGPVLVTDLDSQASQLRWPAFAPLAVTAGACAMFALPMTVGAIRFGVFALHRTRPGPLTPAALPDSLAFADLALRLLLDEQAGVPMPVDGAMDGELPLHAPQVHQATGMIAMQLDVGVADALVRLRATAFAAQRPLGELAADVVARRVRFHPNGDAS